MRGPYRLQWIDVAGRLQQRWYVADQPPLWWTRPLAAVYGAAGSVRRGLYRRGWLGTERLPVPIIVVGNLVVGGAGKTPVVIALVEALRARGLRPGVVSRGYGGSARVPCLLPVNADPRVVGDEPALIRARTQVPVAVGADRAAAARLLLRNDVDVIVADDGLQHYALARDIEICVIDGVRRLGNRCLLPAGPLREPESRLADVDFIVCNGGTPVAGEIPLRLILTDATAVGDPANRRALASFAGQRVHAVAGIGNPQRFFAALRGFGMDLVTHAFPDHHAYGLPDLSFTEDLPVLMTEKDAVKCRPFASVHWWCVPATARLPDTFFDAVLARVLPAMAASSKPGTAAQG